MFKKRGFEIQFNWIFVLIAGTAILLFFTVIAVKQRSLSETSAKATVLKSVDAIITSASVSTDTTDQLTIPNSNIEVQCNSVSLGSGVSKSYQNLILFSPSLIKGDKIVWQTMPFSAPFRATNLLYMTGQQVRYIIIGANAPNSLAGRVVKSLTSYLGKEFYQEYQHENIKNTNNYKVKFIFFDNLNIKDNNFPSSLVKMQDSDVTAIKIIGNEEKGNVEFYQKNSQNGKWNSKGSSPYFGKSSLIGAIYADNKEMYECNMINAIKKLNVVNKIYTNRLGNLKIKKPECDSIYSKAELSLNAINSITQNIVETNIITNEELASATSSLIGFNGEAQRSSCPLIY